MKKVLLATTALTLSAGIAAADGHTGVSITGFAEMGIRDDGPNDVQFHQDIDITFSMSGEADNGLSFGTAIDIDEVGANATGTSTTALSDAGADNPFGGPQDGGVSVFISGDFGTLTLGDTDGAFDWALTEIVSGGSLQDDAEHGGYDGNAGLDGSGDGQILRYDNTFGDFSFAVSFEQDADGVTGVPADSATGDTFGVGVKGSFGDFSVGGDFGPVNVVVNFADRDTATDDYAGIGVTYADGPLTLHANFAQDFGGDEGFGIHADYDLGGGLEAQFGYGSDDTSDDTWSLGFAMSF